MSVAATGFRTGSEILAEESSPVELLRRVRKIESEQDRLQRWMQGHEKRLAQIEEKTRTLCPTCGMVHRPGGACP